MSSLERYKGAFIGEQHNAWRELDSVINNLMSRTGNVPLQFQDSIAINPQSNPNKSAASVPSPASFSVVGVDGKFIISIANPQNVLPQSVGLVGLRALTALNAQTAPILHNIQSSADLNFNLQSPVRDYGISAQLGYEFQNPQVTLFWRLRSSYDGTNWNAWQIYSSPITCGPVGVASGFLRSFARAPNSPQNQTNFATVDSIDNGTNATIRVYGPGGVGTGWTVNMGGTIMPLTGSYPAALLPGYAYGSQYNVYYDLVNGIFVVITAGNFVQTVPDRYQWIGLVTTVNMGGGGGTMGGGQGVGGNGGRPQPN